MSLAERDEVFPGVAHIGEDLVRVFEQLMAGGGQSHMPSQAIKQPASQILLQGFDGMTDGGLGEMELARCKSETSQPGQGTEGKQFTAV